MGAELRFDLTNVIETEERTGNRAKYAFQFETDGEWRSGTKYGGDWSSEAVLHAPGEGFSWTFDVTLAGLSKHHSFCGDFEPGTYRFVYWGTAPTFGVPFEVIEADSASGQ